MGRLPARLHDATRRRAARLRRYVWWTVCLCLCSSGLLAVPSEVYAVELPSFVHVEREEDLYELHDEGLLDEDIFESLLDLYRAGVDLELASREVLYSLPNLSYAEVDAILAYRAQRTGEFTPEALREVGILSARKLKALQGFLVPSTHQAPHTRVTRPTLRGDLRLITHRLLQDAGLPPSTLQARLRYHERSDVYWAAGAAGAVQRQRPGDVSFDPARGALLADPAETRLVVPKFYLMRSAPGWRAIAGSYRIGFGQGVTFDTTGAPRMERFVPDDTLRRGQAPTRACRQSAGELPASPCAGNASGVYTTPDVSWSEGLRGLAVSAPNLRVGPGSFALHGFVSWQTHSVYQYQLVDRTRCSAVDPSECATPPTLVRQADPYAPSPGHAWQTLDDLYNVGLVGTRLTYAFQPRLRIGTTGYAAMLHWRLPDARLDLRDWARLPSGGPFGAIGIDAAFGWRRVDLHLELARSADSTSAGGGLGGVARMVLGLGHGELDTSLRYYDAGFANPFARSVAAPDRFQGLAARDEYGARIRYAAHLSPARLDLRALGDLWRRPSLNATRMHAQLRVDRDFDGGWIPGLEFDVVDRDLHRLGPQTCFEGHAWDDEAGEVLACGGGRYHLTGRLTFAPSRKLQLTLRHRRTLMDDRAYPDQLRQDLASWVTLRLHPWPALRLIARLRHRHLDLANPARLEHSLQAYVEAHVQMAKQTRVRVRYEHLSWLDHRPATLTRTPSPAHWLWFELQLGFNTN